MTKALSAVRRTAILPTPDTKTDTVIRALTNRLEDGSDWRRRAIPARLAPTEGDRDLMVARVETIDAWLTPARVDAIKRVVGMVRGLMASASVGDVHQVLDGYAAVLRPFPEAVVEDICHRFLDGRLGNRVYAPTPAEIAHECRLAVADALAERGRIMLILDAEVYDSPSEADQAKIAERHAAFVAETAGRARVSSKPAPEPLKPDRDPYLTAELESRRLRREAREDGEAKDPTVSHPSHEETESAT